MLGFDLNVARRAARQRTGCGSVALVAVLSAPFFLWYVPGELARWRIRPFRPGIFVALALVVLCCVAVNVALGEQSVRKAKWVHFYGRRVRARVVRRPWLRARLLGRFRAVLEADAGQQACSGGPREVARLQPGDEVTVVVEDPMPPVPPRFEAAVWLPWWSPDAPGSTRADAERRTLAVLASLLRPLERKIARSLSWVVGVSPVGLAHALDHAAEQVGGRSGGGDGAAAESRLLVAMACASRRATRDVPAAGYLADCCVLALALRAAAGRFARRFPEGSREREAALAVLEEDPQATPAWAALLAGLRRRQVAGAGPG